MASELAVPSSVTVDPINTLCGAPALATGGALQKFTPNVQSLVLISLAPPPQPASKVALNPKQIKTFILNVPCL